MTMYIDSQEGTTLEQSQRLLKLGLSPSTADMFWYEDFVRTYDGEPIEGWVLSIGYHPDGIPAWSLHRLIKICCDSSNHKPLESVPIEHSYDNIICYLEWAIEHNYLNSIYLKSF